MRVLFFNRYFYPDNSATSQILSDLAFALARQGIDVSIVTSRLNYTDPNADYPSHEVIDGVTIHRLWTTRFGRNNLLGRAIDYLSFYLSALILGMRLVSRNTIVVAKTDPPMISIIVSMICAIRRARYINWLQDLFPEVGAAAGIGILSGVPGRMIRWVRNISLKHAVCNVAIGERMAELVRAQGLDDAKVEVIHNWSITPDEVDNSYQREDYMKNWNISDQFIVGYSGNFGRAHDYQTIRDAIFALQDDKQILFLFIGGGVYYDKLQQECEAASLDTVQFRPYQDKARLPVSLSVPDVHLITLDGRMEGFIVPSKFYGIIGVGKPLIFVGDKQGEIADIVRRHDCGRAVESGCPNQLVDSVRDLHADREKLLQLGSNAADIAAEYFEREHAINSWAELITRFSRQ